MYLIPYNREQPAAASGQTTFASAGAQAAAAAAASSGPTTAARILGSGTQAQPRSLVAPTPVSGGRGAAPVSFLYYFLIYFVLYIIF